jgi:DNA-directed RNA polymerase subunit RPC12/RpoP
MKIKKFTCLTCGAPKVNAYKNPYVVCDYCGHIMDVDYAAGLEVWNHSEAHTNEYIKKKVIFESNSAKYVQQKNREAYWKEQYNYWDYYYQHYPEYLPPSIPKGEKYDLFIKAAADMMVDSVFGNAPTDNADAYTKAYSSLEYYQKNGKNLVTYESFTKMMDAYLVLLEDGFRVTYDNPQYAIFHEVLPEEFQSKMKLSQIAQIWIPYLEDKYADAFLEKYKLKHEYIEMEDPQRMQVVCEDCKKDLSVPAGALQCICPHCRHENILRNTVHCMNCGNENPLPEKWSLVIDCNTCGTELRVVQPLFG